MSLFKPKKDMCNTCIGYKVGHMTEEEWQDHMRFKDVTNTEKETDKARAKASLEENNKKFTAFCMDLESMLLAPSTQASTMYLKTKLAVHNFTGFWSCNMVCLEQNLRRTTRK